MAKKETKSGATKARANRAAAPAKADKGKKAGTVAGLVRGAGKKAKTLASNPAVTEVVAAALVAAAAAIKDPNKARQLANQAGDELTRATKAGVKSGSAFWQLAMEIARRSLDTLGPEVAKPAAKKKKKKKKQ